MRYGDYGTLSLLCNDRANVASATIVFPVVCHQLALATGDKARQQEIEHTAEGTSLEGYLANDTAEAEAYSGHLQKAKKLFQLSATKTREHGLPELAENQELNGVTSLSSLGDIDEAATIIDEATAHPVGGARTFISAALAWAILGNENKTRLYADRAATLELTNTIINRVEIPVAYAACELRTGHPHEALERLSGNRLYDYDSMMQLMAPYLRGLAMKGAGSTDRT